MNNTIILDEKAVNEVKKIIGGGDAPSQLVFGTLTKNEEQGYLDILDCSLSYQEIFDYFDEEGKTVILQYTQKNDEDSERNYYYAIENADFYDNHYEFQGQAFKQSNGLSGWIEWDYENQTFKFNNGAM